MFPNWTGWKTVKLALTGLGVAAGALSVSDALPPSVRAIATAVGAVDGAFLTAVIALSGTAAGPTVAK